MTHYCALTAVIVSSTFAPCTSSFTTTVVRVGVMTDNGVMRITINDNGRGFHPEAGHGGFGLDSMRERAELIGATLTISSQPQDGSRVELRLPLAHREGIDGN